MASLSCPNCDAALDPRHDGLLVLGLAVFGFYASRGGQPLLGRLADDPLGGAA